MKEFVMLMPFWFMIIDIFTFAEVFHRGKNYYKTHFITDVVNGLNPRFLLTFQCDLQNEKFYCLKSSQRITSRLCWPIILGNQTHRSGCQNSLWRGTNARNVGLWFSLWWLPYLISTYLILDQNISLLYRHCTAVLNKLIPFRTAIMRI